MKVGVTGKGERGGDMLPVINNNVSKGLAGPAGDKTGSRDTRNPGTQRRLCHPAKALLTDSRASAVGNAGESSSHPKGMHQDGGTAANGLTILLNLRFKWGCRSSLKPSEGGDQV